ncbi:zf-HC2 domain-containing protein [Streptomyces xiangluensis]|uniref:Zf-HC2 domain-containing protein n=1 Tax=Streptomyces xiangluensis TaxID=2665720 RepID=A0ABV8YRR0_9ACTN
MRSLERHRDVGAYALGVLDAADAFRFEDHLMECPQCAMQIRELAPTTRSLRAYAEATPRTVNPMTRPGPALLDRLLEDVARSRRKGRTRWLFAVAAAVVIAVGGPAVAVLAGGSDADGQRVAATDPGTGVWAEVTTHDRAWGSDIDFMVKGISEPQPCELVAIGSDGSEETLMNWQAGGGTPSPMQASASMNTDEITGYEVRTGDKTLVKLKAP